MHADRFPLEVDSSNFGFFRVAPTARRRNQRLMTETCMNYGTTTLSVSWVAVVGFCDEFFVGGKVFCVGFVRLKVGGEEVSGVGC